jgi:uncharacterized membrane protein
MLAVIAGAELSILSSSKVSKAHWNATQTHPHSTRANAVMMMMMMMVVVVILLLLIQLFIIYVRSQ